MKIKIAYDCRHLQKSNLDDGVSRYSFELLSAIISLNASIEAYFIGYKNTNSGDRLAALLLKGGVFLPAFDRKKSPSINYVFAQAIFPGLLRKNKIDLFHSLFQTDALMFSSIPQIITVHDLGAYYNFSDSLRKRVEEALNRPIRLDFKSGYRFKLLKKARSILADSEFTKKRIVELDLAKQELVEVVYPGLTPGLSAKANELRRVTKISGIGNPYIFMVGRIQPYKNLLGAIRAVKILRDRAVFQGKLVIAGAAKSPGEKEYLKFCLETAKDLGIQDKIYFIGYVPDEELKYLYAEAAVFLQSSFLEGFGFPPLEAAASGTSVVISDIGSLPEILPEAIRVSPFNPAEIADGIETALKVKRLLPVQWNTWEDAAKKVIGIYKNIAGAVAN